MVPSEDRRAAPARPASPTVHAYSGKGHHPLDLRDLARIAFVALTAWLTWLRVGERLFGVDLLGFLGILIGGFPIFRTVLADLRARRMTMELSMTIALGASLAIGEVFPALVIIFFVLAAEVLEDLTVNRGRRAIKDLLDFLPRAAMVRRDGQEGEVQADDLRADDVVIVKPGARIPVDGIVVRGHSFVDQSTITGESLPAEKVVGAPLFAGTVNQSGLLEVQATRIGPDTTFGRIIEAVEQAEKSRAPIQKTADRLAAYLIYFAFTAGALTFLVTRDARSTISVIIVAGACGVAAGTPLAILGAIGQAARRGAIVKGGRYLELLSSIDTVVLDKTGTLTFGSPRVAEVQPHDGISLQAVMEAAAIAERPSEHPLGQAILQHAAAHGLAAPWPDRFEYLPGKGIVCSVDGEEIIVGSRVLLAERGVTLQGAAADGDERSAVHVARAGRFLGSIRISDVLRPEAASAVRALRATGLRTILLTGDARTIAEAIGRELGVDEIGADLLPEQKVARIRALVAEGSRVAMVGDGVNDAPALMEASVGVAMGSGTDLARESGDVVLLGNDLLKFVETLNVARRCRRIIMANFAGTLLVDSVGVGLAAFGLLGPVLAAFIHVASELAFILNSARLLPAVASTPLPENAK